APEELFIFSIVEVEFGADVSLFLDIGTGFVNLSPSHVPVRPETVVARWRHIVGAGETSDYLFGFLPHGLRADDKNAIEIAFLDALLEFTLHHFIARRQDHVAPDALKARFGEQSLHFIF